ncbi:Uncharacterised protein [Vibrio cholerae]|nr:Uncharacterised protein [Vibrio cholerae]
MSQFERGNVDCSTTKSEKLLIGIASNALKQ